MTALAMLGVVALGLFGLLAFLSSRRNGHLPAAPIALVIDTSTGHKKCRTGGVTSIDMLTRRMEALENRCRQADERQSASQARINEMASVIANLQAQVSTQTTIIRRLRKARFMSFRPFVITRRISGPDNTRTNPIAVIIGALLGALFGGVGSWTWAPGTYVASGLPVTNDLPNQLAYIGFMALAGAVAGAVIMSRFFRLSR